MDVNGIRNKSTASFRNLTETDRAILESYKAILPGLMLVYGKCCIVSLHSAENPSYPCIAVENGALEEMYIGKPLSEFTADALMDEAGPDGKNTIGLYYTKAPNEHAMKCVVNVIRNAKKELIGALCISIDVSVPVHEFMRNFIPVVDNDLASSISDPVAPVPNVDNIIYQAISQAIANASSHRGLSAPERNRMVVQQLQERGIFNIRSAVNIVAKELGVSRYSVYNYLKEIQTNGYT